MGKLVGYICKSCDYKVSSIAGKGAIMTGEFIPYVCKPCATIEDVFFDRYEPIKLFNLDNNEDPNEPKCSTCKKTMSEEWDTVNKPCPKCDSGKLEFDPEAESLMID